MVSRGGLIPTLRTRRVPQQIPPTKGHVAKVVGNHPARERFAETGEDFDGFHRAETADGAGNGAEDGEFSLPGGGWFGV